MKSNTKKQSNPINKANSASTKATAPLVINTSGGQMPDSNQKSNSKDKINQDNSAFRNKQS